VAGVGVAYWKTFIMDIQTYLGNEFELNPPLSESEQLQYIGQIKGPVTEDYLGFMKLFNGGEGPIGNESYLALFRLNKLPSYNNDLRELYSAVDYTVFASDGGNVLFAFNKAKEVIEFDLIGLGTDEAIKCADSFTAFLATLP